MRPGQQNRRQRGRNNGGGGNNNNNNNNQRRHQNPLARSYESSGPDVKIRGNAQHIAEKYAQLARDALSSGDRVLAESYLQHAEHYNRIIAAAMAQMPQQNDHSRRDWDDDADEDGDDDDQPQQDAQPEPVQANGNGSQPHAQREQRAERPERENRGERGERNERGDRDNRGDRPHRDANRQGGNQPGRERPAPVQPVMAADAAQPDIEGVPVEFADAESAGLARTLGLAKPVPQRAEGEGDAPRGRARRPRRTFDEAPAEAVAVATDDAAPAEGATAAE
jgi:hypothetical protein